MAAPDFSAIESPADWTAGDYPGMAAFSEVLGQAERDELRAAAGRLPASMADWVALGPEQVSLPLLQPRLDRVTEALERGRGFAVLRGIGLPPDDFDMVRRIKWALAVNLGDVIAQNAKGEMMGSVRAEHVGERTTDTRGYVSNDELRFHCDGGDVATLLCIRPAPGGGTNSLVSSVAIHNVMTRECPEHLGALYRGLPLYMRKEAAAEGELESGQIPRIPIFRVDDGLLSCFSNLRLMELSYETAGTPMPEEERSALDAFEEIAERGAMKIEFKLESGDMLLTHNLSVMHKRSAFEDDPDPAKARLLLRLWYNVRGGRTETLQTPEQRRGYFTQAPPVIQLDTEAAA